jgi:hypothetical protein
MEKIKHLIICSMLLVITGALSAENAQDMMGQYKQMGEGTSANFPGELEALMPEDFKLETKSFVFKETANMFLLVAVSGSRKNDVYRKFGHDAVIEVGVMTYNPQSASYLASTMPDVLQATKNGYSKGSENTGEWEYEPVSVSKINQADVYIQKGTRKKVEIDNFRYEDQVYYFANAVMLKKNTMLTIKIIYYPLNRDKVTAAIKEITGFVLKTEFNNYMK